MTHGTGTKIFILLPGIIHPITVIPDITTAPGDIIIGIIGMAIMAGDATHTLIPIGRELVIQDITIIMGEDTQIMDITTTTMAMVTMTIQKVLTEEVVDLD